MEEPAGSSMFIKTIPRSSSGTKPVLSVEDDHQIPPTAKSKMKPVTHLFYRENELIFRNDLQLL